MIPSKLDNFLIVSEPLPHYFRAIMHFVTSEGASPTFLTPQKMTTAGGIEQKLRAIFINDVYTLISLDMSIF